MTNGTEAPVAALPRMCARAFTFAQQLRGARDPGKAHELRDEIIRLLTDLDNDAARAGIDATAISSARYALAALFDEIVLSSNWTIRDDWAARPLQLELFNDYSAGEQFFTRLEQLQGAKDQTRLALMEIYTLCLGLGFRGKHGGVAGIETLQRLRKGLAAELRAVAGDGQGLSPHWQSETSLPNLVRGIPIWAVLAVCGLILAILYTILSLLLP